MAYDDRFDEIHPHERMPRYGGVAGYRGPGSSRLGWSLAFAAGTAAVLMLGARSRHERSTLRVRQGRLEEMPAHAPEVERSLTIERPVEQLYRLWRDSEKLARVLEFAVEVRSAADGGSRWTFSGPLRRSYAWNMRLAEDLAGRRLSWTAAPDDGDAVIREFAVSLRPATGDRGTVVSLRARFDPPGGMLGDAALMLFGGALPGTLASKALHRFKSLALTGEIPTTDRQPAARADTR